MSDTRMWIGIEDAAYFMSGEDACMSHWAASRNVPPETQERMRQGGHERHYPGTDQSLGEMCALAVRRLMDQSGLRPGAVDMLIHAHTLVTSIAAPPLSMVAGLARDLGMHRADAFSVSNLHCASMIGALRIIRNLMAVEPELRNVVVVAADTTRGPELWHQNVTNVPSEGAAAIWVSRDCRRNRIGAIEIETVADLYVGYSATPNQRRMIDMTSQISTLRVIKSAIKRSGLTAANIVKLVPHNVSRPGWREVGKRFSDREDFVFDRNIAEKGHAYCADVVINMVDGGLLDPRGDEAVVAAVRGAAGVYAAFVLQAAC